MYLRELIEKYFRLNQKIRDEQTRKSYRIAMRNFAEAVGRELSIEDLSDDNVCAMMSLLSERNLAARTINERRGRINTFWTWLAKRGMVSRWPTVGPIPEPVRIPVAWTQRELKILFQAFDEERVLVAGIPAPLWWKSLHCTFWDTAERVSALMQCRWSDLRDDLLIIPAEYRKGKRRDAAYPLAADTLAAIDRIREPERSHIWPWPHAKDYLWTRYKMIRKRAGLPTDRQSSFHRMRRSVASHYKAAGGDATQLLGHSSGIITEAYYIDPRVAKRPAARDLLFRPG